MISSNLALQPPRLINCKLSIDIILITFLPLIALIQSQLTIQRILQNLFDDIIQWIRHLFTIWSMIQPID